MSDPIDVLMDEHRVIEKVLDALEAAAAQDLPLQFYEKAIDFLASFADRCHHMKEEDALFPMLEERGIPREGGPIGVMCQEHLVGREHMRRLRDYLAAEDREGLRRESLDYVALLRQHIEKEDNVLFVMARHALDANDVSALEAHFDDARKAGVCDVRYRALADELLQEAGAVA